MSAPSSSLPTHRPPASSSNSTRNAPTRHGNRTALPPPPLVHPPKLPQRPSGSPASKFREQIRLAGLFTFRCRLRRKIPQSLHTHLLQPLPSHSQARDACLTSAHPTQGHCCRYNAPIPTATVFPPSLSAYLRPRPFFHPFTRHSDLPHIHILLRLPLSYNDVYTNVTGSEAAGVIHLWATLKSPLSTPMAVKCQNEGRSGRPSTSTRSWEHPLVPAQTEPGPEPRLNARPDRRVESRVADSESQRLRDIWCVSSSIPPSTTLLGPRVPRYSLPSLTLSFHFPSSDL